jgi:hypothetical protein
VVTYRAFHLVLILIAAAVHGAAIAQAPDRARVAAAKQMMELAGAAKQFDEVMPLIADQMARSLTAVAPDKGKEIAEVFRQLLPRFLHRKAELLDQVAALYAAELTLDELNGVIAFYKSAVGMKFAAVQPGVIRQSMALGQRWGRQIGSELDAEVRRELKKRGIDL